MRNRDKILALFEEDVASSLLEFGKTLSKIEADIVVFLARKSLCLYDLLQRLGAPPVQKCLVSDRLLDMDLAPFHGKRVALIDDTLIVGTTMARTKKRLEDEAKARVQTHVFCLDTDWYCDKLIKPDSVCLELSDERVMTFCTAEVRALSILPRPYLVDFPLSKVVKLSSSEAQHLLSSTDWFGIRLSTLLQERHDVSVVTFFPTDVVKAEIAEHLTPELFACIELAKVRAFAKRAGSSFFLQFVPLVTLRPLREGDLETLLSYCVRGIELATKENLGKVIQSAITPHAKQRLLQFILSSALANLFRDMAKSALGREIGAHADDNETDRHFGPWLHDEMSCISKFSTFRNLSRLPLTTTVTKIRPAALPSRVSDWAANTIGTDGARKKFKTKQPKIGQISLLADFAEIFRRIYDKREIPARREAQALGKKVLLGTQETPYRDRLEMGIPWVLLVEWMAGLHDVKTSSRATNIFSLLLDLCNDLGIAVPVTCIQEGIVFRAYRHGEDVKFSDGELALAYETVRGFLQSNRRTKVPRLTLEKLLVLLIKVGVSQNFLEPLYGASGAEGTCRIGFDLKGARAMFMRGPKDRTERNIWLADYLVGRGVIQEVAEKRKQYSLGRKPEGNFLVSHAPNEALTLGLIVGELMRHSKREPSILNEDDLTLLATCATPRHTANALQVELHIFQDWFESGGANVLRRIRWDDPESLRTTIKQLVNGRGHEAIHSAKFKFYGYRTRRIEEIVTNCTQELWSINPVSGSKWDSYWKGLLKTYRTQEMQTFDPLIERAALLIWKIACCLSAAEISLRYHESILQTGSSENLERAFRKLRDFRRDMGLCGLSEPPLVSAVSNRFKRIDLVKQTELQLDSETEVEELKGNSNEFKPSAAVNYALEQVEQCLFDVTRLVDTIEPLVEEFGKAADRFDFKYMLYYDIIDSTATKAGNEGQDVQRYRRAVGHFKKHVNSLLNDQTRRADKEGGEVFCQNGNKSSDNDSKQIYFRGPSALRLLTETLTFILRGTADFGVRVRFYAIPCNFAGSSAYRQGFDPEIRGERFLEYSSRVQKAAVAIEERFRFQESFLMLISTELINTIRLPAEIKLEHTREEELCPEIELLTRKVNARYGSVRFVN